MAHEPGKIDYEAEKLSLDCVKYLTTLTTGLIVFLVGFQDKLQISMLHFLHMIRHLELCLMAAVFYLFVVSASVTWPQKINRWLKLATLSFAFYEFAYGVGFVMGVAEAISTPIPR